MRVEVREVSSREKPEHTARLQEISDRPGFDSGVESSAGGAGEASDGAFVDADPANDGTKGDSSDESGH